MLITYDYGEYKANAARELLQILSEINGVREQIANYENEFEPGVMHWSSDDSDDDQDDDLDEDQDDDSDDASPDVDEPA